MAETIQDLLDEMTPEQRGVLDLVVGAAVADEEIEDDDLLDEYEGLPDLHKYLIDFIVGGVLDQEETMAHDSLKVDAFLAHYGVKGMKWGFRKTDNGGSTRKTNAPLQGAGTSANLSGSTLNTKENRAEARRRVRNGTATAEEAHVAALKSNGHRVANAFLGDKSYWKGIAITLGVAGGAVAASAGLPSVLPADTLKTIGEMGYFAGGSIVKPSAEDARAMAPVALTTATAAAAAVGAQISGSVLGITNIYRAVTGNSKVDRSYAALGDKAIANQKKGAKRTAKVLRKSGGLSGRKSKKAIQHDWQLEAEEYLEHYGVKGMKWGVRNRSSTSGGGKSQTKAKPSEKTSAGAAHNRAAAMVVGKEVAKAAVKYGLPAGAIALGAGIPLAATLGVSVKVLDDPAVKEALAPVGSAVKSVAKSASDIKLSDIPNPVSGVKNWIKEAEASSARSKASIAESEALIKRVNADRAAFDKEIADVLGANSEKQAEIAAIEARIAELDKEEAALRR